LKVLFNDEEVAEVYFDYINRHADAEQTDECPLEFHTDLTHKSATQIIRSARTPIWRRLKTLAFYLDSDIFKYEGIDAKGKKLVTVIIPFAQVNSIQTWSRRIKKLKTKSEMKTLDATTVQDLR
jgi:hypothetical protein